MFEIQMQGGGKPKSVLEKIDSFHNQNLRFVWDLHTAYYRYKKRFFFVKNKTATVLRGTLCGGKAEAQTLQNVEKNLVFLRFFFIIFRRETECF